MVGMSERWKTLLVVVAVPEEERKVAAEVVVASLVAEEEVVGVADEDVETAVACVAVDRSGTLVSCAYPSDAAPSTSSVTTFRDICAMFRVTEKRAVPAPQCLLLLLFDFPGAYFSSVFECLSLMIILNDPLTFRERA